VPLLLVVLAAIVGCDSFALDPALFGEPLTLAASAEASDGVEFGICRIEGRSHFPR
jgi:hypothetical protein